MVLSLRSGASWYLELCPLTTYLPPPQPWDSVWFFSAISHYDPVRFSDSKSVVLTDSMTEMLLSGWLHVGPVRSSRETVGREYSGVEDNMPFREEIHKNSYISIGQLCKCNSFAV